MLAFARAQVGGDIERAIRIGGFRPRYEVPGRRVDGSVAGRRRALWVTTKALLLVRNVIATALVNALLWVVTLPLALLDSGHDFDFVDCRREHQVRGRKDCDALGFADAGNHAKVWEPVLWLLESPERLVLLRVRRGRLTTIWEGRGAERPRLRKSRILQWPDGSTVGIPIHDW